MWKALRPFNTLIAQLHERGRKEAGHIPHRLLKPPTREDICHGYRLILGRDPESEQIIAEQMQHVNVASFRLGLLISQEFRRQYWAICAPNVPDPYWSMGRPTLAIIHLQKTGGTSLRTLLEGQFPTERVCPYRFYLYALPISELSEYDFFSGHFDFSSLRYIPRNDIKTVSLFREPCARLISMYRFHKSHPLDGEFADNRFVRLAKELSAERFFEHPDVRSSPETYNNYLLAFGRSFSWFVDNQSSLSKEELSLAVEDAKRQISTLTTLGITERFDQSVELICKALHMPQPESIEAVHVTDNFGEQDARFCRVDPVTTTPRLAAALEDLTVYDDEIYRFAVSEFDRRCAALNVFRA
jgi:hypothetical protein